MKRSDKEAYFNDLMVRYRNVVAKVCYMYRSEQAPLNDLYQEVMLNIWQGLDGFRGEAKVSTWIYRTAINTCITWHRRNSKHAGNVRLDDLQLEVAFEDSTVPAELRVMYGLISRLSPVEKALVTLWLDENSYEEIAAVLGITRANVAIKLHRIKEKLAQMAKDIDV